jgi:hypothetical protein
LTGDQGPMNHATEVFQPLQADEVVRPALAAESS